MRLDKRILQHLAVRIDVTNYLRIIDRAHGHNPLGMGYGRTRFSSPRDAFKLLYLAQDSRTAIAERIIRDRFQGRAKREILADELKRYAILPVQNVVPVTVVDLRHEGASLLGVSTDAVRSRAQVAGRALSQELYDRTSLDGVVYMSRITNRECVAIYDRAVAAKLQAAAPAPSLTRLASLAGDLRALQVTVISDADATS